MIPLEQIQQAREQVAPYIVRTPLLRNQTLSQRLGAKVYLKYELFQRTGSFKPRGAFNQLLHLDRRHPSGQGVIGVSGGNFAQGAAFAGERLGVPVKILMPQYTPANYIAATRGYGAEVELAPSMPEAFQRAEQYRQEGWAILHAWDNPHQMAGNGTIGLELLEDLPDMTDVFISIGGGGLIAGITSAIKALKPQVRVWGVETEGASTMWQALQAGNVVHIQPNSLAKTLSAPYVAEEALEITQQHVEEVILVSDQEAVEAQRFLLERAKVLTELAASCTLAAADKKGGRFSASDHIVLLLCGGNESLENMIAYREKLAAP